MNVDDDDTNGIGGTGYTLDDLADYAERGRTPAIDAIEGSAECQAVLDSLDRLHLLSAELIAEEAAAVDESWIDGILNTISREVRAGRDIPFPSDDPGTTLAVTEGALRELVRTAGDGVDGVLIGRSRIEQTEPGHARIEVTATMTATRSLRAIADDLRGRIATSVERHAPFTVDEVDVTIVDVHEPEEGDA